MTHYYFCTYFNKNYSDKGLALYRSLELYVNSFTLYILCLDDETYQILSHLNLPSARLIRLRDLEERDQELFSIKDSRSIVEYYFTITSAFILDILNQYEHIDIITYLDADMYFFSDITPAYDEMGDNSILIVEHRFPDNLKHLENFGRFNVGYLSFRRDNNGIQCLDWWRRRCIDWCYDRLEGEDKFADQKYLDKWPDLFQGVKILHHTGVNYAPWNILRHRCWKNEDGCVYIDNDPLIVTHFHGLKFLFESNGCFRYSMGVSQYLQGGNIYQIHELTILEEVYRLYIESLLSARDEVRDTLHKLQLKNDLFDCDVRKNQKNMKAFVNFFVMLIRNLMSRDIWKFCHYD